jgi:hypothetical protein
VVHTHPEDRIMADQNQGRDTGFRRAQPEGTAQDPHAAEVQRQVHEDAEASRAAAARVEASTPAEVRDKTVGEIVDDAERRAERSGTTRK